MPTFWLVSSRQTRPLWSWHVWFKLLSLIQVAASTVPSTSAPRGSSARLAYQHKIPRESTRLGEALRDTLRFCETLHPYCACAFVTLSSVNPQRWLELTHSCLWSPLSHCFRPLSRFSFSAQRIHYVSRM